MFGRAASGTETRTTLGTVLESGDIRGRRDYEPQPFGASTCYAGGILSGAQTDLAMRNPDRHEPRDIYTLQYKET